LQLDPRDDVCIVISRSIYFWDGYGRGDVMALAGGPKNGWKGDEGPSKNGQKPPNLEKLSNVEMAGYLVCWYCKYWYIYLDVYEETLPASAGP
jgi:hypothetical protein